MGSGFANKAGVEGAVKADLEGAIVPEADPVTTQGVSGVFDASCCICFLTKRAGDRSQ